MIIHQYQKCDEDERLAAVEDTIRGDSNEYLFPKNEY